MAWAAARMPKVYTLVSENRVYTLVSERLSIAQSERSLALLPEGIQKRFERFRRGWS